MSVVTLMASALETELIRRGIFAVDPSGASTWVKFTDCEAIISTVIGRTAELTQAYELSPPAPRPPGVHLEAGASTPSDASAVDFSGDRQQSPPSAPPAPPRMSDGGRAPSGAAPAVTPTAEGEDFDLPELIRYTAGRRDYARIEGSAACERFSLAELEAIVCGLERMQ